MALVPPLPPSSEGLSEKGAVVLLFHLPREDFHALGPQSGDETAGRLESQDPAGSWHCYFLAGHLPLGVSASPSMIGGG